MPTTDEATVVAPAVTNPAPKSKMRQLLLKRLRQLLRATIALAICVLIAATGLGIWWLTCLNGLPDIGEPFDVAAFRSFRVPDDQNAFAYLRQANAKLTPIRGEKGDYGTYPRGPKFSWSSTSPMWRDWAEANREAFELFRRGALQSDASLRDGDSAREVDPTWGMNLAILEGSRRQESGDTAAAWDCYRLVLQMITHCRRRGSAVQRYNGKRMNRGLQYQLTDWAADPKTTIAQLHVALEEVLKSEPNPDWNIAAIKSAYVELMRAIERPMPVSAQQELEGEWTLRLGDMTLSPAMIDYIETARRFLLREPERSRRVLRLLCASYLAHAEARERPPSAPAVWARFTYQISTNPIRTGKINVPLYPASPEAPDEARALPPEKLAGWLVSTLHARLEVVSSHNQLWPWPPERMVDGRGDADRTAHRNLVIMLATELYRRERGSPPPSDEALVGTYLKSLPEEYFPDVNDGTAPVVE